MTELRPNEFEGHYNEACDRGVPPDKAYFLATDKCDTAYRARLAATANPARLPRKEGEA